MAAPKKSRKRRIQVERDIAKVMAATRPAGELSAGELYKRLMESQQAKLDRDLPWRHSYANWCTHLGRAAARHNARIEYGSGTYAAWESGISPDAYARERARSGLNRR